MWGAELVPAPPWRTNEKSCRRSSVVFCAVEPENAHPCIRRPNPSLPGPSRGVLCRSLHRPARPRTNTVSSPPSLSVPYDERDRSQGVPHRPSRGEFAPGASRSWLHPFDRSPPPPRDEEGGTSRTEGHGRARNGGVMSWPGLLTPFALMLRLRSHDPDIGPDATLDPPK